MSDIKFRAWDIISKKMLEWGDIFHLPAWEIFPGTPEQRVFGIMQYTGCNDKNGKETYTGDIVKLTLSSGTELIALITSGNGAYFAGNYPLCSNVINHWEVLGNIYENRELLDKENV